MHSNPNIILLTVDCLRYDYAPPSEKSYAVTSHLYKLSRRCIAFKYAIANGSYTLPSLISIFSSTYPLMFGISNVSNTYLAYRVTIPEVLKRKGYYTALFHSNVFFQSFERKFDYIFDAEVFERRAKSDSVEQKIKSKIISTALDILNYLSKRSEVGIWIRVWLQMLFRKYRRYMNDEIVLMEALKWIKKTKEPFFIWLHLMQLHPPHYLPEEYIPSDLTLSEILKVSYKATWAPERLSLEEIKILKRIYELEVKVVDNLIGQFIEGVIDELGDNFIMFITSDHGEGLGEHGKIGHGNSLYEEIIHIPLLLYVPNKKGAIINELVSQLDILPTICDLVNVKPSSLFKGKSLITFIKNAQRSSTNIHLMENIISESPEGRKTRFSIRCKDLKLILTLETRGWKVEVYDLYRDPLEKNNIIYKIKNYPQINRLMRKLRKHILAEKETWKLKFKLKAKIRKLKYLSNI